MALFSLHTAGHLHPYLNYEYLLTNGIGAFTSSTLVGCNTRRYHGLLVAATLPPLGRIMTLNRVGELIYLDGNTQSFLELSISQFGNSFHPRGEKHLRSFHLDRSAKFEYDVEGISICKEIQLLWQRNTVAIRYKVDAPNNRQVRLDLLPFISLRDFHSLRHSKDSKPFNTSCDNNQLQIRDEHHALLLRSNAGKFESRSDWWFGHTYAIESERGLDDSEDLFVPGLLSHSARTPFTLIAGYPWFADWGRDTMISLPGLLPRAPAASPRPPGALACSPSTSARG
jgi:predicted glycogen debranching enzyme